MKTKNRIAVVLASLVMLAGLPAAAQDTPRTGGVLRAAMIGEPPSLDLHWTTAVITQQITWHVYETLYTYDREFTPIPMLAEGHTVSDGGRRYTLQLRKGVRFHNGKEMTSADVVASLTRWGRMATPGKALWKNVEAVEARDPYIVVVHLKEPSGSFLYGLAGYNNGAAVYPKEVIDAVGDGQIKEFIGTGPYRFVEHRPDRHIKLVRFKDYAARSEPPNGLGGKRTAYLDEILFIPVPDVAVRLAGVETGEYQFANQIKQDQYERIKKVQGVEARIVKPGAWPTAVLNHKEGLMTSKKLRQAVQAALDMEPIMAAGFGDKTFYRLDGSIFFPEQIWHSTVSVGAYNQRDKDKARRLLKEAGYAGQPVRWMTTREYEYMYKTALVSKQQLEEVGFKVDLQVLDWATLVQRRNKPELYDVFSTAFVFGADPALGSSLQCNWPGWWCHPDKERLLAELQRETDVKKRKALIDQIQAIFYEDVGRIKYGDFFSLDVVRKELKGDFRSSLVLFFWNAWLTR
ncbi:MAG TPA: ABC transporter substrate-binding protein [Methylomirabilota bacterium]|jgi:peptide/nickel transport system substrate-binding protein|nr:ABC transporter substrate-binding protein [Methylomirabilota bacterium]